MEPKKFTVEELLEDASLSQMNTIEGSKEYNDWKIIIDFLLDYKSSERHSEFMWQEDSVEWNTNMKTDDAN